jgi:hypothetical protein
MADLETIDISDDSVVVLKHHGSYMQQNRDLQRTDKQGYAQSFQVHTPKHTHTLTHAHTHTLGWPLLPCPENLHGRCCTVWVLLVPMRRGAACSGN